ncbi:MAG TPA: hypothetical protein DDW67_08005 [Elusimicrobia bacterium]|nr:hypothetical protein [Elusimicrobiota bacterium]
MKKTERRISRGRLAGALSLLASLPLFPAPCPAGEGGLEAGVKAAYIYNFTQFVEWEAPSSTAAAAGKFTVCVLGGGPMASSLAALDGRKAGAAEIKVLRLKENGPFSDCRILFIPGSLGGSLPALLRGLGRGVLTVSDMPGFAGKGGIIGFFTEEKRVRIEVNPRRAGEAGLKLSPRLLQVSRIIGDPR